MRIKYEIKLVLPTYAIGLCKLNCYFIFSTCRLIYYREILHALINSKDIKRFEVNKKIFIIK